MKILVTGGAGYIGSVVAFELIKLGHQVIIFDDLSTGHIASIPTDAKFILGSVLNRAEIAPALDEVDAVMHFAAKSLVGESVTKPELYWQTNLEGTRNLLEEMRIAKVSKIVFSSTAAVYGDPIESPITEKAATLPKSPYGESKLAVDHLLTEYCRDFGFAAISLRYFNVAGAVGRFGELHDPETHLIPRALKAILQNDNSFYIYGDDWLTPDGTCIRDYIHVADLADAHIIALAKFEFGKHLICNLGTESGSSVLEVIAAIEEVTGKVLNKQIAERRPGDPAVLVTSNKYAKEILGWQPTRNINQIIQDSYDFMKTHK